MRKLLLFTIAMGMLVGGSCLLGAQYFFARGIYLRGLVVAATLLTLGGYLLWTDFVAPLLHIKTWEDR